MESASASRSSMTSSSRSSKHDDHSAPSFPVETIVSFLVEAKKSLGVVELVYDANNIITQAKSGLEAAVIVAAKTKFLRENISEEFKVVKELEKWLKRVREERMEECKVILSQADAADSAVASTMDILRSTTVASHLRPAGESPRSLLDFIDEEALERIRATLKADIDLTADNNVDYHTLLENFASDKQRIIYVMKQAASLDDEELDDLKNLIDELESHAEEMAVGLTSLTAHFDLASKAVLHTEGGYNALQHAASNNELPEGVTAQDVIPSSQSTADTTPISAAERHEMLNVLAGDAAQVPEVIAEIEDHHNAMRNILSSIQETLQYIDTAFKGTRDAFEVLQSFEVRLPHYTTYPNEYVHAWTQYKSDLLNSTAELNRLNEFYMDYLESYAKLLEEVDRRASAEEQMRSKLEMAVNRVEQIREADKEMRDRFRAEVGDFLPVDIFPGLVEDAPRYRVVVVDDIGMSFKSNEDAFERAVEEGFEGEQQE